MNRTLFPIGFLSALILAACSNAGGGGPDDSSEGALTNGEAAGRNEFLVEVGKCTKAHETAAQRAEATNDMIQAQAAFTACLKKANDGAVTRIEKNLTEAQRPEKGTSAAAIAGFRKASDALCAELGKASENFGGSLARVEGAACAAHREKFLSDLIGRYPTMGDEGISISDDRAHHKTCYRIFDKRFDDSQGQQNMNQVALTLRDCISRRVTLLAKPIATIEFKNDGTVGDEAAVTANVQKVTATSIESGGKLCAVLVQAGEWSGGSLAGLATAGCQTHVAENVFTELRTQIEDN